VAIPANIVPALEAHLAAYGEPGPDGLLFPAVGGGFLAPSTFAKSWYPARAAAGRPDLRFHDLRHAGATWAAATGATLAQLQARLGHSTVTAAMTYQRATTDADQAVADALAALATAAPVVPLPRGRSVRTGRDSGATS